LRRITVAFNAPLHVKGVHFICQRHLVHSAMASGAPDALVHMNAVVEVDEIGQIVNARPLDGLPRPEAGTDRLEKFRIRPNL